MRCFPISKCLNPKPLCLLCKPDCSWHKVSHSSAPLLSPCLLLNVGIKSLPISYLSNQIHFLHTVDQRSVKIKGYHFFSLHFITLKTL